MKNYYKTPFYPDAIKIVVCFNNNALCYFTTKDEEEAESYCQSLKNMGYSESVLSR